MLNFMLVIEPNFLGAVTLLAGWWDLDLCDNRQTSLWEYDADEEEMMLLEVFRLQAGLERRHRWAFRSLVL